MKRRSVLCGILIALMCALPLVGMARDTSPLRVNAVRTPRREDLGKARAFRADRSRQGIEVRKGWLRQVKLGGILMDVRLSTPDGETVLFQENLALLSEDGGRLTLQLQQADNLGNRILQVTQGALDRLIREGIVRIMVIDRDYYIQNSYLTAELYEICSAIGLGNKEQLCVAGEEDPVTVITESGMRRVITN